MNILDIVLISIAAIFLIRGLFRGLVQEVLSLFAILVAVYLAANFRYIIAPHLEMYISSELAVSTLTYIIIFISTLLAFWLIAKLIRTVLDISLLGWVDRGAGGLFGLLEGALIGLIGLMFLQSFAPNSEWLQGSYIAPRSQHIIKFMGDLTPDSMREAIESTGLSLPSPSEAIDSAKEAIGLDDAQQPE